MTDRDPRRAGSDLAFGAAVLVCGAAALLAHLDERVLSSPHEARVLETAREMDAAGDLVVPRFLGELRAQKPPLAYWAAVAAARVAGEPSLPGTRRIAAGLGILTLLSTFALGAALFDRRTAALAAAALGSSLLFVEEFRKATPDPFLAAFSTASAAAMAWAWRLHGWRVRLCGGAAAAALALALLAKGPIALLFAALAWFATRPAGARIRWFAAAAGLAGALVPIAIWARAVALREPAAAGVFLDEIWRRLPGDDDGGGGGAWGSRGPWLYVTELALGLLPVTAILAVALTPRSAAAGPVRKWFLLGLAALALMSSRKAAYLLPLLPAAALLVGRVAAAAGSGAASAVTKAERAALTFQAAAVPIASCGLLGMFAAASGRITATSLAIGGGALLFAAGAALAALFRRRAPVRSVLLAGLLGTGLWTGVHEAHEPQDLSRFHLGRFIADRVPDQEPLLTVEAPDPVVAFYARRVPGRREATAVEAERLQGPVWVLAPRERGRDGALGAEVAATLEGFRQGARPGRAGDARAIALFRRWR